jgi:hypothetical protein
MIDTQAETGLSWSLLGISAFQYLQVPDLERIHAVSGGNTRIDCKIWTLPDIGWSENFQRQDQTAARVRT